MGSVCGGCGFAASRRGDGTAGRVSALELPGCATQARTSAAAAWDTWEDDARGAVQRAYQTFVQPPPYLPMPSASEPAIEERLRCLTTEELVRALTLDELRAYGMHLTHRLRNHPND